MVFAHYMLANLDSQPDDDPSQEKQIAAYEKEIREAQSVGIDGFALNAGGWLREPYYIRRAAQMFEAAARLQSGFKLMFSADMCCGNMAADVEDMLRRFANNPRYARVYFQHEGRFVLTTFAGEKLGPMAWAQIRLDLLRGTNPSTTIEPNVLASAAAAPSNAPLPTFFVPAFFWGGERPAPADIRAGLDVWAPVLGGGFYWGIAGVPGGPKDLDTVRSSDAYAQALHGAHKLYMAPVCLQFWGSNANRYYEYSGAQGMRRLWESAIRTHAEWVEIITWNDFVEGSYVSPLPDWTLYPGGIPGVPAGTRGYFHSHAGATALLSYFIRWYKTGAPPPIDRDQLFYFYRSQAAKIEAHEPPVEHRFGPVADRVYVTANLVAPATLTVRTAAGESTHELPAGSSDIEVPLSAPEPPRFVLSRQGKAVLSGAAEVPINPHPRWNNFYYVSGVLPADATSPAH